jgi:hypothetical protein
MDSAGFFGPKKAGHSWLCLKLTLLSLLFFHPWVGPAQNAIKLQLRPMDSQLELRWPAEWVSPTGNTNYPSYEVQRSDDLQHWQPIGQKLQGTRGSPPELTALVGSGVPKGFYRVVGALPSAAPKVLAASGDEEFGYAARFADELQRLGQISPQEFADRYGRIQMFHYQCKYHFIRTLHLIVKKCSK